MTKKATSPLAQLDRAKLPPDIRWRHYHADQATCAVCKRPYEERLDLLDPLESNRPAGTDSAKNYWIQFDYRTRNAPCGHWTTCCRDRCTLAYYGTVKKHRDLVAKLDPARILSAFEGRVRFRHNDIDAPGVPRLFCQLCGERIQAWDLMGMWRDPNGTEREPVNQNRLVPGKRARRLREKKREEALSEKGKEKAPVGEVEAPVTEKQKDGDDEMNVAGKTGEVGGKQNTDRNRRVAKDWTDTGYRKEEGMVEPGSESEDDLGRDNNVMVSAEKGPKKETMNENAGKNSAEQDWSRLANKKEGGTGPMSDSENGSMSSSAFRSEAGRGGCWFSVRNYFSGGISSPCMVDFFCLYDDESDAESDRV